jgi:hypothetical protein
MTHGFHFIWRCGRGGAKSQRNAKILFCIVSVNGSAYPRVIENFADRYATILRSKHAIEQVCEWSAENQQFSITKIALSIYSGKHALTKNTPFESKSQSKRTDEQIAEQWRSLRCDRVANVRVGDLASAALE